MADLIKNTISLKQRKRILFYTPMTSWMKTVFEYFLAANLRLKGHDVLFALCDGKLLHCEMERATFSRPTCEDCSALGRYRFDIFNHPAIWLSEKFDVNKITELNQRIMSMPLSDLLNYKIEGYEVGKEAFEYLTVYYHGMVRKESINLEIERVLRRVAAGNLISYEFARIVIEKFNPDTVYVFNGKLATVAPAYFLARSQGRNVVTWEDYPPYQDSYIFAEGSPGIYGEIPGSVWLEEKDILTKAQERKAKKFLNNWQSGLIGDFIYHEEAQNSSSAKKKLNLNPDLPLLVAFTNVVWDSSSLGRDVGFESMAHWIFSLIRWAVLHQEKQVAIRVHPAESKVPESYKTTSSVVSLIEKEFGKELPDNIRIIDSSENINSYALSEAADIIMVYTTSLGYELAALGRRVWVSGLVHYKGHGFTSDIEDAEHQSQILNDEQTWQKRFLTEEEIKLAKKYVYMRHYKQITRIPYLHRDEAEFKKRPFSET